MHAHVGKSRINQCVHVESDGRGKKLSVPPLCAPVFMFCGCGSGVKCVCVCGSGGVAVDVQMCIILRACE